jgi:hypothetical protein
VCAFDLHQFLLQQYKNVIHTPLYMSFPGHKKISATHVQNQNQFLNIMLDEDIPNSSRNALCTTRVGSTLAPLHMSPFNSWFASTFSHSTAKTPHQLASHGHKKEKKRKQTIDCEKYVD